MKKLISTIAAIFAAAFIFAEGSTYTVKSVTGKVTYQTGNDKWSDVAVGKTLSSTTVVNTSMNSVLVLTDKDGKDVKIKPLSKDSIENLAKSGSSGGLKKTTIKKNEVAGKSEGASKGVATASSRADDAQSELSWDE